MRGCRGSALFLCVITVAAVSVCSVFSQGARYRFLESRTSRAMRAQINATLTDVDRTMYERYGFPGFMEDSLNLRVFDRMTDPDADVRDVLTIPLYPFSDPQVFGDAVNVYMRYRLPVILAVQVADRIRSVTDSFKGKADGIKDTAEGEIDLSGLSDWLTGFDFSTFLEDVEETEESDADGESEANGDEVDPEEEEIEPVEDPVDALRSQIQAFLIDKILGEVLLGELQKIRDTLIHFKDLEILEEETDFPFPELLDPNEVSDFIEGMDDWLRLDADPLYQKIGRVEYVMGMCGRRLPVSEAGLAACTYADGIGERDFDSLYLSEGPDVERILSGNTDKDGAERWVRTAITAIRFVVSTLSIYSDPTRLAKAQSIAAAVSGVVALISAGAVVIPEPALTIVVAAVWGFAEGYRDAGRIVDGQRLPVFPGLDPVLLGYDDYLRMFLLVMPEATLMARLADAVARNVPGTFCQGLKIYVELGDRVMSMKGRSAS